MTQRKELLAARAVLFPELGNDPAPVLAEGVLRAPRRGLHPPPVLSVCAAATPLASARSPGVPTPGQILRERGWESSALLARAAASRQALVAARVGGAWWEADTEPELPAGDIAVVAVAEPALADIAADRTADPKSEGAMLDAALSAYAPERVVVLAAARTGAET